MRRVLTGCAALLFWGVPLCSSRHGGPCCPRPLHFQPGSPPAGWSARRAGLGPGSPNFGFPAGGTRRRTPGLGNHRGADPLLGRGLYFGGICYDSQPDLILARELKRDSELRNDDTFTILLDTFHDHRNAFVFRTNPRGTKFDAQITDEQRELNGERDEKWRTAARIGEQGWVLEIEIPWKTLRSQPSRLQTWGIDFERVIRRQGEETYGANTIRTMSITPFPVTVTWSTSRRFKVDSGCG